MSFRRKITRRQFIKGAAITGGAMMLSSLPPFMRQGHAFAISPQLTKFKDPMPLWGPDIPLANPFTTQPYAGVDYYQLTAGVYRQQLHSELPASIQDGVTGSGQRLYGYADHSGVHKHLGGAVLATEGRPVRFTFASALPPSHILPYDTSIPSPGNGGDRKDRAAVHLHGGLVPWTSDGGPFHWQCPDSTVVGASVIPWLWDGGMLADGVTPDVNSTVWDYFYPNEQSARLMWYHDHAIAQTRLNAYAGIATGYLVQDGLDNFANTGILNTVNKIPFLGQPIVFQDKVFWNPVSDPTYNLYVPGAQTGDLWYPWFYDPALWPIARGGAPPTPSAIPEFFGDTMLANGHVFPFHEVGVGRYRFRLLNACNARWLDLSFVQENPAVPGEPLFGRNGRPIAANVDVWQIGTEGGFLPTPVQLFRAGVPLAQPSFFLGPAERADIIIDFKATGKVILYNVAGAPFPGGAPINDWYVGNRKLPVALTPGMGPNTRTIMQFRVVSAPANPPSPISIPATIPVGYIPTVPDPVNGGLMVNPTYLNAAGTVYTDPFTGKQYNYNPTPVVLTLNEVVEPPGFATGVANPGRLLTLIGSQAGAALAPFGAGGIYYTEPPTESVQYGELRIWHIFNNTVDAHPMHFHLFNVQILGRRVATRNLTFTRAAVPPLPNEKGYKETVTAFPGEAIIVAVLVEDPLPIGKYPRSTTTGRPQVPVTTAAGTVVNCELPFSPRLQAAPYNLSVDEYVWHCHILEHEEHDMMRPLTASY